MLNYLRSLPDQDLAQRRRFVVVATASVFGIILVLYILLRALGPDTPVAPSPSPSPSIPLPEISAVPIDLPLVLPSSAPASEVPGPLIRPSPTPVPTARATPAYTSEPTL